MENIDIICASNLSYDEKIKALEKEKEDANLLIESAKEHSEKVDNALIELEDGKYLPAMKKSREFFVNRLKWEIPTTAVSLGVGTYGYILLQNMPESEITAEKLITVLLCTGLGVTCSLNFVKSLVNDIVNIGKYNRSIESYQRRLK